MSADEVPNDPDYSHYVISGDYLVGEAKDVEIDYFAPGISFAYVRLFGLEDFAEYGSVENKNLLPKSATKFM